MNLSQTNTSEVLWGCINDKSVSGFNEILTLAVDDRQSIACQCELQKHQALLANQWLDDIVDQSDQQVVTNRHH
jgi:hypothetical protein